ncbi:MAG: hypothetical protein JNK82_16855 [Myxococcaceae bacterium]|nr:hypothetical protein [Myxococcaceae bacterium]
MGHLTKESWARLLANPRSEPELFEHLKSGCETCEAFLAGEPHPLLDGVTDAGLLHGPRATNDDARAAATYARIREPRRPAVSGDATASQRGGVPGTADGRQGSRPAVSGDATASQRGGVPGTADGRRETPWGLALAAVLLAVLGAALLVLKPKEEGASGIKGGPHLTLELSGVVKSAEGALTRVERGQTIAAAGTLLLRYHASDAAQAKLAVVRDGRREELGAVSLESGTHDLTREGALLGLSLEGERGRVVVRVEAVGSAAELEVNVGP